METKLNPSRKNNFSAIVSDLKLPDSLTEKTNFISNTSTIFLVLLLIFSSLNSFAQIACSADFEVNKGRNVRSSPLDGTYYTMVIKNKSHFSSVYSLSAQNINGSCSNTDGSSTAGNVNINAAFLDIRRNPISQINLNAGESVKFLVHITVPIGTNIDKWCCTQIVANSNCSNYKVSTVLHTLVINPIDE